MEEHASAIAGTPGEISPLEPTAPPDPVAEAEAADQKPERLPGPARLHPLADTRGHYVVLWAPKPKRGGRAQFEEVAFVEAHDPDHAKKVVLGEAGRSPRPVAERDEIARFLIAQAENSRGILLRAVPAMHWPADVETTSFVRPDPILKIG